MQAQIETLQQEAAAAIEAAQTMDELDAIRIDFLGRKAGKLNDILRGLKDLSDEEKRVVGPAANVAKQTIEELLTARERVIGSGAGDTSDFDLSLPGIRPKKGHYHPLTKVRRELLEIFTSMGFRVYEGPELDNDYYNFESLNIPKSHPARDMQDTFFIKTPITRKEKTELDDSKWVMRTHTSNTQVRIMEQSEGAIRCIVPGRVFRNEATDATHEHTFNQLEGFVVDKDISIGQLTGTLQEIFTQIVGTDTKIRLRPGFFPFTEPSYEVDAYMPRVKKGTDWIEMGGSGMIHPNVLRAGGYDPEEYSGFAFGMGWTRIAMLKYGITDIRLLANADIRFLEQF